MKTVSLAAWWASGRDEGVVETRQGGTDGPLTARVMSRLAGSKEHRRPSCYAGAVYCSSTACGFVVVDPAGSQRLRWSQLQGVHGISVHALFFSYVLFESCLVRPEVEG